MHGRRGFDTRGAFHGRVTADRPSCPAVRAWPRHWTAEACDCRFPAATPPRGEYLAGATEPGRRRSHGRGAEGLTQEMQISECRVQSGIQIEVQSELRRGNDVM